MALPKHRGTIKYSVSSCIKKLPSNIESQTAVPGFSFLQMDCRELKTFHISSHINSDFEYHMSNRFSTRFKRSILSKQARSDTPTSNNQIVQPDRRQPETGPEIAHRVLQVRESEKLNLISLKEFNHLSLPNSGVLDLACLVFSSCAVSPVTLEHSKNEFQNKSSLRVQTLSDISYNKTN